MVRGAILRAYTKEVIPPKIKLFVIWGFEESLNQIGVSFINSDIIFIKQPWLQALQHPLLLRNYPTILSHDSFLECSKICEMDLKKLRELITNDTSVFLGNVLPADLSASEKIIQNASTIENKLKKRYGFI